MKSVRISALAIVATALNATATGPALAQNSIGTLDEAREAHQLCYEATASSELDRTVVTDRGWALVTVLSNDGTRRKSDSIYFSRTSSAIIVMPPDRGLCVARTQFPGGDPIQEYLDEFTSYKPEKTAEGRYMFCAEGRVGSLEQTERDRGPLLAAAYSTQVESGRCHQG